MVALTLASSFRAVTTMCSMRTAIHQPPADRSHGCRRCLYYCCCSCCCCCWWWGSTEQMFDCCFPLIWRWLLADAPILVHVDMILGMRTRAEQVSVVVMCYWNCDKYLCLWGAVVVLCAKQSKTRQERKKGEGRRKKTNTWNKLYWKDRLWADELSIPRISMQGMIGGQDRHTHTKMIADRPITFQLATNR